MKKTDGIVGILTVGITLTGIPAVQAGTVIGDDAINRTISDGWSNFVLGMTTKVFSEAGLVTAWEVYSNNTGDLAMLLLRNTSGNNYEIIGADFENVVAGLNSFLFTPDIGTANVMAGDILGLYIGTAKVDFDPGESTDSVAWCANNGCISNPGNQLVAGATFSLTGDQNFPTNEHRIYSANVTVKTIPEPSTILGVGTTIAFGRDFKRKLSKAKKK